MLKLIIKLTLTDFFVKVGFEEIDEMIKIVDRNGDGRISYSEFRWFLLLMIVCGEMGSFLQGDDGGLPSDNPRWPGHENEDWRESPGPYEKWKVKSDLLQVF